MVPVKCRIAWGKTSTWNWGKPYHAGYLQNETTISLPVSQIMFSDWLCYSQLIFILLWKISGGKQNGRYFFAFCALTCLQLSYSTWHRSRDEWQGGKGMMGKGKTTTSSSLVFCFPSTLGSCFMGYVKMIGDDSVLCPSEFHLFQYNYLKSWGMFMASPLPLYTGKMSEQFCPMIAGSSALWKTWKGKEFQSAIFQAWKVVVLRCWPWKVMENDFEIVQWNKSNYM